MAENVPDGSPMFRHTDEGPDDMSAHVRSILTNMEMTIPVSAGRLALGIWQGIFLWEHRTHAHHRKVVVTVSGS
jgi:secondary thiamine-phosphate synthase enzyme